MPKGDNLVLGKLGGSGELIPAALRWLRRRRTPETDALPIITSDTLTLTSAIVPSSAEAAIAEIPPALELGTSPLIPTADDVEELRAQVEIHRNDPLLRWQLGLALVAAR